MPSLSEILLPALPMWLALVLLVPKRPWRTICARLVATAAGERRHPFGPPLLPADGISSRFVRLLVAELPRCLQLGVPLWLATLTAEHRGFRQRRLAAAEHAASPAGWMWAGVLGRLGDEELERRLSDSGYPTPAAKVQRPSFAPHSRPAPSWLRELDLRAAEPSADPASSGNLRHQRTPLSSPRLSVRMLGGLRVCLGQEDLSAELLARPTLSYIWQYLLLRAIQGSGPEARAAVADEVYPGVDSETQHARIRRRLHDLQHKVRALGRYVVVTDRDLRFDLESCDVDVVAILKLANNVRASGSSDPALLAGTLIGALEDAVAATVAEFLPQWDELEYAVNRGRGQSGEDVRALRALLVEARAALLTRLGAHYLARREVGRAVATLDEAFRLDPGRDGVAEMMARALEAAGARARAADVRQRYVPRE